MTSSLQEVVLINYDKSVEKVAWPVVVLGSPWAKHYFMGVKAFLSSALIVFAVSGCNLFNGRCTYELRSYDGDGRAVANGNAIIDAHVNLSEQRGSIVRQSFSWQVTGGLKGHVTSASCSDSFDPSHVLLDLPVLGADRTSIAEGTADSRDGAVIAGFHDILIAGRGIIELQSDQPTLTIPIETTNAGGWVRPYCS